MGLVKRGCRASKCARHAAAVGTLLWARCHGCQVCASLHLAAGVPLAQQQVVLEYRMDRTVATADDPPVVLGRMPDAFVQQLG